MTGATLHIFNPDTDFALGYDGDNFTPKANIISLRRRLALLPSLWAAPGDAILLLDAPEKNMLYADKVKEKTLRLVSVEDLDDNDFAAIKPWGWNPTIRRLLERHNIRSALLPSPGRMEALKELAHRRTTVAFHQLVDTPSELLPCELTSMADIEEWCEAHPGGYLKAPWSSSGRGVRRVLPGDNLTLTRWLTGTLKRQKSVMAEPDWKQEFDFATEWDIHHGEAHFMGYSLFEVDSRAQYKGNSRASQQEILSLLQSRGWTERLLQKQRYAINRIIAPRYSGPAGIDALYSPTLGFNLCVEINLRLTMGLINILKTGNTTLQ